MTFVVRTDLSQFLRSPCMCTRSSGHRSLCVKMKASVRILTHGLSFISKQVRKQARGLLCELSDTPNHCPFRRPAEPCMKASLRAEVTFLAPGFS